MIWALILIVNSPSGLASYNVGAAAVSGFDSQERCEAAGRQVAELPGGAKIGVLWTCVQLKK